MGFIIRSIRTPAEMNKAMVDYAQKAGVSINTLYNDAVKAFLEGQANGGKDEKVS